jgi:hypothetical protein
MKVMRGDDNWAHVNAHLMPHGNEHWMRRNPELAAHSRRGVNNGKARLTEEDVLRIRREWDGSWTSTRWLADLYEMPPTVINGILHRKTWTHLPAQHGTVQPSVRHIARGESVSSAVLTADIALDVWQRWQAFTHKHRTRAAFCRAVAEQHGVRPVAIDKILRGQTWRHATQP